MIPELDWFPQKVIRVGGSLAITIPSNNAKFSGIKEGDTIKVYYKKIKEVDKHGTGRDTKHI